MSVCLYVCLFVTTNQPNFPSSPNQTRWNHFCYFLFCFVFQFLLMTTHTIYTYILFMCTFGSCFEFLFISLPLPLTVCLFILFFICETVVFWTVAIQTMFITVISSKIVSIFYFFLSLSYLSTILFLLYFHSYIIYSVVCQSTLLMLNKNNNKSYDKNIFI